MEWLNRLSNAIGYMEEHLDGEISYEEAAKIACCSTFYFQRMFSYVAGISLSEYIRRRRMTQAAFELQNTDLKVIEIAMKYGYTSAASFNRAFHSIHGASPIAARQRRCNLNSYPPIRFSVNVIGGEAMSYRVVVKESIRIVGVRTPLKSDMEENQRMVPLFWEELRKSSQFTEIQKLNNLSPNGLFGITACHENGDIYYYIGVSTDRPVPKGMYELSIPSATWVVFENNGYFKESVQSIFKRFLTEWLPFSGYMYAELPDIEVYEKVDDEKRKGHSEVWIAVKREGKK